MDKRRCLLALISFSCLALLAPASAHAAGGGSSSPLAFDPDLAIFTAVVFLTLWLFLSKFAWRPIVEGLGIRESSISEQVDEAKRNADKANNALAEYEGKLTAAREEVRAILMKTRQEAEAAGDLIVSKERSAAQQERDKALEDIGAAKDAALSELKPRSTSTAASLASRILKRKVDPKNHADLTS